LLVRTLRAQKLMMLGDLRGARDDIEVIDQLAVEHPLDASAQAHRQLAELQYLYLSGERRAFQRQIDLLDEQAANVALARTAVWPWLVLWRVEIALSDDALDVARALVRDALARSEINANCIVSAQLLQFRALVSALQAKRYVARCEVENALRQRSDAGGDVQLLFGLLTSGQVYAQLGERELASEQLSAVVRGARTRQLAPLLAGALLQRGWLELRAGQPKLAAADLREWLEVMREHGLRRCIGWLPAVARAALEFALREGICSAFASELVGALDQGIDERGRLVPKLHVRCLGSFEFRIGGEVRLSQSSFTPAQRSLLALLLASPELSLDQSVVQLALWPDSSPEKSRSKFDTMLSRLRSLLNKALAPWSAASYLSLKRGVLSLTNVRVDAQVFRREGTLGAQLVKSRPWEAEWRLRCALWEWRGRFCMGVDNLYSVGDERERLFEQYGDFCRLFADLAEREGREREAASLLRTYFSHNPLDEALAQRLCALYARLRRSDQLIEVMRMHKAALDEMERELEIAGSDGNRF
jgi:DNA-binding SARP family transcriptional activator